MPQRRRLTVTIFGSAAPKTSDRAYLAAYELGAEIARRGWALCNGGYGGTMEAAAKGAVDHGGHSIGVTCELFGRRGPNAFIRQEVPTFDLFTRLNTLIRLADAFVVLPGGTGTLLELAAVWELSNKRLLRRRRPLVLLGDAWNPVVQSVQTTQSEAPAPLTAATPAEAAALLATHLSSDRTEDQAAAENTRR